jgi:hypothetical protein
MSYPYNTANDSATVTGYTRCTFLQSYGGLPTGTDAGSLGAAGGSLTGSMTNQHPGFKPGDIVFLKDATASRLAATQPPIVAVSAYALPTRWVVDDL